MFHVIPDDPASVEMRHIAQEADKATFFESLTEPQLRQMSRILMIVAHGDDPGTVAGRYLGTAETYLAIRFKSCVCGTMHDQDAALKEVLDSGEAGETKAEDQQDSPEG